MEVTFDQPPFWRFNRRALEITATVEGRPVTLLIPVEVMYTQYGMTPGGEGPAALRAFETHRAEIEGRVRDLVNGREPAEPFWVVKE